MGSGILFTDEQKAIVIDSIRRGAPRKMAAAKAFCCYSTIKNHMSKDHDFRDRVKQAEAEFAEECIEKIRAEPAWTASAWFLERRHPEEFGRDRLLKEVIELRKLIAESNGQKLEDGTPDEGDEDGDSGGDVSVNSTEKDTDKKNTHEPNDRPGDSSGGD